MSHLIVPSITRPCYRPDIQRPAGSARRRRRCDLTDFGIATWEGATSLTQSGAFVGSPGYVAPEVALGQLPGPQADLWSLGAGALRPMLAPGGRETPAAFVSPSLLNDARAGILISSLDGQPALSRRLIAAGAALRHFRAPPARTLMIVAP